MSKPFQVISRKNCAAGGGVFALLLRLFRLHRHHKGGILIEFTFSIPVCIALLFLVNDHYRFYELKNKAKTSAYLAASMVQQIKNDKTDKTLTKDDLARITFASCLNFFHTNTMFQPWPFGIYYSVSYEWVKRINSNRYQYQHNYSHTRTTSRITMNESSECQNVTYMTQAQVEKKNPDLVCDKDGDERVCVESAYRNRFDISYSNSKLRFFILTPKTHNGIDGTDNLLFSYQIVFTPKPGLFPAKN